MLLSLGRIDEGRAELAALVELPSRAPDLARLEVAGLRAFAEVLETGGYDLAAFDDMVASMPPGSDLALEARAARAVTETRSRLARDEPDALGPLVDVRAALGHAATAVTLRRTWLSLARSLAFFGLAISLTGYVVRLVG
jgi:hypothetical protein